MTGILLAVLIPLAYAAVGIAGGRLNYMHERARYIEEKTGDDLAETVNPSANREFEAVAYAKNRWELSNDASEARAAAALIFFLWPIVGGIGLIYLTVKGAGRLIFSRPPKTAAEKRLGARIELEAANREKAELQAKLWQLEAEDAAWREEHGQ